MNDIDLSNDALLKHRAIAEKATPGPWAVQIYNGGPYPGPFQIWSQSAPNAILVSISVEGSRNCAHIAANSPNVVIAHVDEILRLRNELAATECREGEGDAYVEQLCLERDDLEAQVARLEGEVERLNKEADWLAARLAGECKAGRWCPGDMGGGNDCPIPRSLCGVSGKEWREQARKAVEAEK